ncbi:phosphotransferase family protein [Leucothrix mucor]|uniref:phosphotransferase family protein n=1 Tax=Leucothrix mucor TaxID=45248 RepID=UPI0003B33758|nr:phosphotransferase [Leucothrix mucor]
MQQHWQARINNALQQNYQWTAFAKGSSNQLFKGINQDSANAPVLIARINGANAITPGVNRRRESVLLDELKHFKWAPQIIRNAPEEGWCVMRCYEPLIAKSLTAPQQQQLLAAIAELQSIQPYNPDGLLTIDYHQLMLENYQSLAVQLNDREALEQIAVFERGLFGLPKLPLCLVHHDLHMGNLALNTNTKSTFSESATHEQIPEISSLKSDEQVIILDWEYGGLGNAWFDAAAMHRFLKVSPEDLIKLPAFSTFNTEAFNHGLNAAIKLSETIDALWYWAREINQQCE